MLIKSCKKYELKYANAELQPCRDAEHRVTQLAR